MILKDKYGVPPSAWIAMIRDGVITSKVSRADDILSCYHNKKSSGLTRAQAVKETADEMRCSDRWVNEIINKFPI